MENKHKFVVLDALRGVAALIVVAYHLIPMFGGQFFPHGYLAVDFFFMLSGFVLTHSYQARLDQNWSLRSFLKTRAARLYPLYFPGLVLSVSLFAAHVLSGSAQAQRPGTYFSLFALGVLFIPSPVAVAGYFAVIFPLNPPAWSLFYEMVVNAAHALFGRRRSARFLVWVTAAAALLLAALTLHLGSLDAGEALSQCGYALVRVVFAYTFGCLLHRVWRGGHLRLPNWPMLTAVFLVAVMAIPAQWPHAAVDLISVLVIFPLILLLGAAATPAPWMVRPGLTLGTASYGIYVLHVPFAAIEEQIWFHVRGRTMGSEAPWSGLFLLASTVALVLALDRLYDVPVRRWLAHKLESSRWTAPSLASSAVNPSSAPAPISASHTHDTRNRIPAARKHA